MQPLPMQNNALLSARNLAIGYDLKKNIRLLQKDINLDLYEGDMVCLIGPNGCGKSTLIRTLAGIQKSLAGEIKIMGSDLKTLSDTRRSQLISTVLTERTSVDQITIEEITVLGRYTHSNWLGTISRSDREKIDRALEAVKLTELKLKTFSTISDGEKQRAFIAKALASDAAVILLDEPTAHLDIANRVEILSLLRHLTRQLGHAVLLSTHELDLALQLADEIWMMLPDGTMQIGTPEEIIQTGSLDKAFGNESVYFNRTIGSFAVHKKRLHSVELSGETALLELTIQALNRLGFSTGGYSEPIARIHVENDRWYVSSKHSEFTSNNMAEVCRILRQISSTEK